MRLLLLLTFAFLAACGSKSSDPPADKAAPARPVTDPATARRLLGEGAVVLDVRTPEEFADGRVERAVNVPVQDVAGRLAEIEQLVGGDRARPVVVYCGMGGRAAKAKATLEAAGFTAVVNGGGLEDLLPAPAR